MGSIRVMPAGQPRFFTEPELINETEKDTRISGRIMDSNAQDWWSHRFMVNYYRDMEI